jgi:hypothetical protein
MTPSTEAELKASEATIEDLKRILSQNKYTDEEWSTTTIGFIAQGIEDHAAFVLLIRSDLIGAAFALVRVIVEILVRGVWITTCACDAQITKFRDHDKLDLSFGQMSDAIDASQGLEFFHEFKTQTWNMLNSYTHTGILQLGRRWTGEQLKPSYTEDEITEMTDASTLSLVMLVRPFLAKHGHLDSAKEVDKHMVLLGAKFAARRKP